MQSISQPTRAIFVRHGRSTYNDEQRFSGRSDLAVLTDRGWETARQTGRALRSIRFDAIYTSPLQRAKQTTLAILEEFGARDIPSSAPIECPDLLEIDLPNWAGRTYTSVREELAADYQCWQERPDRFSVTVDREQSYGSAVSYPVLDLFARTQAFWQILLSEHRGQTVLAIAHGGTIRAAIATAIGLPAKHYHQLQQSNCGISVVDFSETRDVAPMRLQSANLTGHLGETLPKLKAGKQGLRVVMVPAQSDRLNPLKQWLAACSIDDCWTDGSDAARHCASQLNGAKPISLRRNLSEWELAAVPLARSKTAVTVLAIASIPVLQQLLETWLQVNATALSKCAIAPNTATILHFPSPERSPILQSLNFVPPSI